MNNKSGREGCRRKLRAELDLLKGEEDVARDKVDVQKTKRRLPGKKAAPFLTLAPRCQGVNSSSVDISCKLTPLYLTL